MSVKSPEFRVEIIDAATEEPIGFFCREDDENPNNNVKIDVMSSVEEVRGKIEDFIDQNEGIATGMALLVECDGKHFGVVYFDEDEWIYELS